MEKEPTLLENQDSITWFMEHNPPNYGVPSSNGAARIPLWTVKPNRSPKGWRFKRADEYYSHVDNVVGKLFVLVEADDNKKILSGVFSDVIELYVEAEARA